MCGSSFFGLHGLPTTNLTGLVMIENGEEENQLSVQLRLL